MENALHKIKEKIKNFFDKSLNNKKDADINSRPKSNVVNNKGQENLKMY